MVVISHVFNRLFDDSENLAIIFEQYIKETQSQVDSLDYSDLKMWLS